MNTLSYTFFFLLGILGYAALLYRVMNRRPGARDDSDMPPDHGGTTHVARRWTR